MDPGRRRPGSTSGRLPRTRGDGPSGGSGSGTTNRASPHTRGWTRQRGVGGAVRAGFPAHAGMDPSRSGPCAPRGWLPRTRGDGPARPGGTHRGDAASPHTRGWTRRANRWGIYRSGFPAHAGMDPMAQCGRIPSLGLPRTRGDGPDDVRRFRVAVAASPHTRGWTPSSGRSFFRTGGFPAHAGMDLSLTPRMGLRWWLPRTRGDGPPIL